MCPRPANTSNRFQNQNSQPTERQSYKIIHSNDQIFHYTLYINVYLPQTGQNRTAENYINSSIPTLKHSSSNAIGSSLSHILTNTQRRVPSTTDPKNAKEPSRCLVLCVEITYLPGQSPRRSSAYMSLTSVFGMVASPSAAGGGSIGGAACERSIKSSMIDAMILSGTANRTGGSIQNEKTSYFGRRFCVRVTYLPG